MAKALKNTNTFPEQGNADIPLNKLIEWPNNPRRTRSQVGLESTAASLKVRGQLMPVLAFKVEGQDMFYVIDGERRRQSFNLNVEKNEMDADVLVKAFILDATTTEADLIAIATVANVEREQMNPIEEMEAYRAMAQAGMKPREIAEQSNISVRQVMQRISLGDLVESARDLVRSETRQIRWAEAMTLGSVAQQERIVAEILANPHAFPDGQSVRMEMTRGNIPVSSALFDVTELADCIVTDLFTTSDEGTFSDSDRFWKRQDQEIKRLEDEHGATHARVDVFRGRRFNDAGWVSGGKPEESVAVIVVKDDGSVTVHTCMVAPAGYYDLDGDDAEDVFGDAQNMFGSDLDTSTLVTAADEVAAENAATSSGTVPIRSIDPMLQATRATEEYLEGQIVAGLRLRAATDMRVSMAFVIAQTLTRHGKLASSMEIPGFNLDADKRTSGVFQKLDARRAAYDRILADTGLLGVRSPSKAVEILIALDDAVLFEIFSWIVSQSVNPGLTPIAFETMEALGETPMDGWVIDETYIGTLNNAQKRALAEEVVPAGNQPSRNASIPLVVRSIISTVEEDALQGDWAGGKDQWLPPQINALHDAAVAKADAEAEAADAKKEADELAARAQAA